MAICYRKQSVNPWAQSPHSHLGTNLWYRILLRIRAVEQELNTLTFYGQIPLRQAYPTVLPFN
jgi:hypothetical protein